MSEDINIQIYINKKEVMYTRQNMIRTINTFLLYLTNPDLDELNDRCKTLKEHRHQKEQQAKLDSKNMPIQSNRYDTPAKLL
tara:strand:- start:165 stop:410 length:246 start_codon:yes stop_codon:yes gene_type:complete